MRNEKSSARPIRQRMQQWAGLTRWENARRCEDGFSSDLSSVRRWSRLRRPLHEALLSASAGITYLGRVILSAAAETGACISSPRIYDPTPSVRGSAPAALPVATHPPPRSSAPQYETTSVDSVAQVPDQRGAAHDVRSHQPAVYLLGNPSSRAPRPRFERPDYHPKCSVAR